ncbi:ATP-binding cassette domain-containing protein [Streptococcus sp. zg-86]|uniref:ATP-binding cassette domain-containing protein n=1 Tax=Streptococcus zhangguiae TaxID=2664091 RepID=A0A6I4RD26_9STRE|nr:MULTISPECIES: ABC transporter ATP-binding protein [unclassified Streptococcus]MTB63558.1 ATP-binding cassette domain-containing protein [Streptococcus sp. zg-86]MTB89793.1 ATP-binding cassette domain-containing protein [Streptococcus sp. zg-36]MWV55464.1 ATP-binding cassette domain-containing protein [Streptococcus sp. zg-70]QTH47656.1 ABC transporter ATP-binding protein [Streptococcus sp. zg-86]
MKKIIYQLRYIILIQICFHIFYSLTNVVLPELNKYLFDRIFNLGVIGLVWLLFAYALTIASNSLFQYISQVYEWKVSKAFFITVKKWLAEVVLSQPLAQFSEKNVSAYLSIFDNDIETIEESYLSSILDIIRSSMSLLIYAVSLFLFVHPLVAVGIILASLLAVFVPKLVSERLSKRQRAFLQDLESYFQVVTDLFSAKNRVNKETFSHISHVHHQSLQGTEEARFRFGKFKTFTNVLNGFSMFIVQLTAFGLVGYLLLKKELTVGAAIATFSYVENFIYPMKYILLDVNAINATKETVRNLERYLDGEVLLPQPPSYPVFDAVSLVGLGYHVGEMRVRELSYCFERGKKYAIVGQSGSGKSTFLRALAGEIAIDEGAIVRKEGADEHLFDPDALFYLSQFEQFYHTDFENNISVYGSYERGRKEVEQLFYSLPSSLQERLQSVIDPDQLSGGEKNIMGIFRALMSGKDMLLLDEPTSHVDPQLTKRLLFALSKLDDKLMVIVLHESDPEILSYFDTVLLVTDGSISEIR